MNRYVSEIAVLSVILISILQASKEGGWTGFFMFLGSGAAMGFYKHLVIENYKEENK